MEIIARVKNQGSLESREWKKDNGEVIDIKSVRLTLKSGKDEILCEASDRLAEGLSKNPVSSDYLCVCSLSLSIRKGKDKQGNEISFQNIRLTDISYL